jgi:hypothetical protein
MYVAIAEWAAGFHVTLMGRFWVIPEAEQDSWLF